MRHAKYDIQAPKQTVSVTLNSDLYAQAKALKINTSQVAEKALEFEVDRRKAEKLKAEIRDRIVAPLVPRKRMAKLAGRLTPVVNVAGVEHVLLVPRMTSVAAADLRVLKAQLTGYRDAIASAIDFLFLGI